MFQFPKGNGVATLGVNFSSAGNGKKRNLVGEVQWLSIGSFARGGGSVKNKKEYEMIAIKCLLLMLIYCSSKKQ